MTRVLLTGSTGFVGSFVAKQLVAAGVPTAVLLRPGTDPWRVADLLPKLTPVAGTLADLTAVEPAVRAFAPDTVLHLAWSGVGNAARNDAAQFDNLAQTVGLLHLTRRIGVATFVGLGSQAEYGPHAGRLDEQTPSRPTTVYGVAKLSAGLFAQRLCGEWGVRCGWLRLFSSYGPTDHPGWMIPDLVRKLLAGERPPLTEGRQMWDYIHVADAAAAVVRVAENPAANGVFNLGSGRPVPLRRVVETVRDAIDPALPLGFGEVSYRPDQVMHLEADVTRLRTVGWAPRVPLAAGLADTIDWYRTHP